jgi:hypothetical protein
VNSFSSNNSVAFHVSGIVLLTTLINGTITDRIYKFLNISVESSHDDELAIAIFKDIENYSVDVIVSRLKKHWFYHNANWETVLGSIPDLALATICHGKVNLDKTAAGQLRRDESDRDMMQKNKLADVVKAIISQQHEPSPNSPSMLGGSFVDHTYRADSDEELSMLEEKLRCGFINAVKANYDLQVQPSQSYI